MYDDIDLANAREPQTSIPKTIGILNITFGTLLLLCVVCSGVQLAMQPAMGPMMGAQQQQLQQQLEAARQMQLQALQRQEQVAPNEVERAQVQAQIKAIKAQPVPKMPDFGKLGQGPLLQGYAITDTGTALVLNLLLVISGIGLVGYREWGRKLALWVAGLKILRLIALETFFIIAVVPVYTAQFGDFFKEFADEINKAGPPGGPRPGAPGAPPDLQQLGTVIGMFLTSAAVVLVVLGVIYPIIVLCLLTRPRVIAACSGKSRPAERDDWGEKRTDLWDDPPRRREDPRDDPPRKSDPPRPSDDPPRQDDDRFRS